MVLSKEDFKKKIDTLEISDDKKIEILEDISGFMFLSFLFTKKGSCFIYKLKENKESLKDERI